MKAYELINKIKGTDASCETILNWMVMNKICPLDVGEELEEGIQPKLDILAGEHCRDHSDCGRECYESFLSMDVETTQDEEGEIGWTD